MFCVASILQVAQTSENRSTSAPFIMLTGWISIPAVPIINFCLALVWLWHRSLMWSARRGSMDLPSCGRFAKEKMQETGDVAPASDDTWDLKSEFGGWGRLGRGSPPALRGRTRDTPSLSVLSRLLWCFGRYNFCLQQLVLTVSMQG